MADFLEERLSDLIRYGSSWQDDFAVDVVRTAGGSEYRRLLHPYPVRSFDISYMLDSARLWSELVDVYHRAHGMYAGFRARCFDEYSTNGARGAVTAFDQTLVAVTAGASYQLVKRYGTDKAAGAAGYSLRKLLKPVSGTTKVAIGATEIRAADWSVATTTGIVTFAADKTYAITGISKAAQAVITFGTTHTLATGQSVQVSGVAGMTQINALRALIVGTTANTITVAINSSAFSTYTSGGNVHTRPQSGETVSGGTEFDFPVRFATALPVGQDYPGWRPVEGVRLVELLNP